MKYMIFNHLIRIWFSFPLAVILSLLLLLNLYFTFGFTMGAFYNSDALYIPSLSQDIIKDFKSISQWNLSRAPSFVDLTIFLAFNIVTNSFISIALFFCVQLLLFSYIVFYIYQQFRINRTYLVFSFLVIVIVVANQIHPYFILLKSAHHYSEYLLTLIATMYFFKYLKQENKKTPSLFFTLFLIFSSLNDQLFLIHFTFPALLFLIIRGIVRRKINKEIFLLCIYLAFLLIICIGLSNILFNNGNELSMALSVEDIKRGMLSILNLIVNLFEKVPYLFFFYSIFFIQSVYLIFFNKRNRDWLAFFYISLIFTLLALMINPSTNILGRYLLPYLFSPIFLVFLLLPIKLLNKVEPLIKCSVSIIFVYIFSSFNFSTLNTEYYPKHVECVDKSLDQNGFYSIAGDYWVARHYSFISQKGIQVTPIKSSWEKNYVVSNPSDFREYFSGVMVDSIDNRGFSKEDAVSVLGTPNNIVVCDKITLLLYNKDSITTQKKKL